MKHTLFTLCILMGSILSYAQAPWTLKQCVDYAIAHNITAKQTALQQQRSEINLHSTQMSRLPDLNGSVGQNFDFGRSINRIGVIVDKTSSSSSFSVSSNTPVFSGFRINNQIAVSKLNLQAAVEDLSHIKDNIAINVASLYLQALYSKELYKVAVSQVEFTQKQVERAEKLVEAGSLPKSELYESKATLAKDELTVIQNQNNMKLALLDLAQLLELTDIEKFDVAEEDISGLLDNNTLFIRNPDSTFAKALEIRGDVRAASYRLESSQKNIKVAQSAFYPSLYFQAGYSNGYYKTYNEENQSFNDQMQNNGREMLSLNLNIPIFNRFDTKNQVKLAKLDVENQTLELENTKKTLLKEVQQAYYNALAAKEKYLSSQKAMQAAKEAFRYAQERYDAGKSTVYEFNDAKSRLIQTEADQTQAKYDYIFRTKILNFYSGEKFN